MKINMTEGSISKSLLKMALPVMGTAFLQMAYNFIDMIWIGKNGSDSIAAVGSAGFYVWLSFAFINISQIGAQVKISQLVGAKKLKQAHEYVKNAIYLNTIIAIIFTGTMIIFRSSLIGFFRLGDANVINMASNYLLIISFGMIFNFTVPVLTSIFAGYGDTKTPFYINGVGLVVNMILDPLLIFGFGKIPALGVRGAAIATVIAQASVLIVFVIYILRGKTRISFKGLFNFPKFDIMKKIFVLGVPAGLQNGLFTVLTMIIARIVAEWGPMGIAVQKVGSQIESLSWMTALGFEVALSAFIGQNYGANKPDRVWKGYKVALVIMSGIGISTSLILYFGAEKLFRIFLQDPESVLNGVLYLKILAFSQIFMCFEIITSGAFNGLGKTKAPSVITTIFNFLRIPLALYLSREDVMGLNGIWWAITISSFFKGGVMVFWFIRLKKKWSFFEPLREN
ncbi:MAG: MATE family efflux transporter [Psychrilyobacter sp.]|nr:MATE family efflux transporter [Psychrilyobacter sp.]